ncbi:MAG: NTP transferase domain-containing protein, partial [Tissierellia bacterium]|nr:NTP transferase domain-containing protein [Tissierellia bacterium]
MKKAIVLAAGEGKRMKSNTPKVLHHVLGISMLENVIRELKKSEIEKIIVIVGHGKEEVIKEIRSYGDNVIYKEQPVGEDAPYGTGFAVMAAIDEIAKDDEVLVVCGDTPLLRGETLKEFMSFNKENNFSASVMTANVEENYGYGRIIKNTQGFVERIVEEKDATDKEKKITEINSGVYTFLGKALLENLNKLDTDNSQGELYLTDVVKILNSQKENVGGF